MKRSWLLLLLLIIIIILTTGCSTNPSSTSSSSTIQNSVSSKNTEIAHAKFCLGTGEISDPSIKFEPPLFQVKTGSFSSLRMPLEPGKYQILVTTSAPETVVRVGASWSRIIKYDKFGTPSQYDGGGGYMGDSNRDSDLNIEFLVPDGAKGEIGLVGPTGDRSGNCGTIIVTRI